MIQTITKIGGAAGLILDQSILDSGQLKVGDQVDVTVDPASGALSVKHAARLVAPGNAAGLADQFITRNDSLFRRLA